jgi:hypothetical protein
MALTINTAISQAAMTGITGNIGAGSILFTTTADAELAILPIASWGTASTANPSVALATMTADTSVTPGTITKFVMRSAAVATRLNGTVGTSAADLIVTNNVVPAGATEVSCTGGISLSLTLS